jgi:hypothetical protein
MFGEDLEHSMSCEAANLSGLEHELLWTAESPGKWPSDARFEAVGDSPQDVPWSCLWPLVSDRVRLLIASTGLTGATFYPVQVTSRLPVPIPRYWYVHFQHVANAIDYERSMWRRMNLQTLPEGTSEQPIMMIKYVLHRESIEGWDFFRCEEQPSAIFCSERFRDLFVEHGCTGLGFAAVPVTG